MRLRFLHVSIIYLMVMVMVISCSTNGSSSTDVMVSTVTPTVMVIPTNTPPPTVIPYGQVREQVITSLREFNLLHNEHVVYMAKVGELQADNYIDLESAGPLILQGLSLYERGVMIWNPPDFNSDTWKDLKYEMNDIRDAELIKIRRFRSLVLQLRDEYMDNDVEGVRGVLQDMESFRNSSTALLSARIQNSMIEAFDINPTLVEFFYEKKQLNDDEQLNDDDSKNM